MSTTSRMFSLQSAYVLGLDFRGDLMIIAYYLMLG